MKGILILLLAFITTSVKSQTNGAQVFGKPKVIQLELTFFQSSFWDSLTTYFSTTQQYMAADLVITTDDSIYNFPNVGIRLKGNSSYGHPGNKKSFKVDFNEYVKGQNFDGLKKINLSNCFKDPTFMREKLFFDACHKMNINAPRINYADVFINGTHWGFYTLSEQIDDQYLDWAISDDAGNLFKAGSAFGTGDEEADLMWYGSDQINYSEKYELNTNETVNDWSDLIALIDFINNSSDTEFENNLNTYIDKTSFLRSMAMDNIFSNLDSYLNSARNYYIYHNMTTDKWEWIKWDANEAFGNYSGGPETGDLTQLVPDYIKQNRPLVERIFNNSNLYNAYLYEHCNIMDMVFSNDSLDPEIDSLKTLIQDYVYADTSKMYSDNNFNTNISSDINGGMGPGGGVIFGLKSFINERNAYLIDAIDCSSISSISNRKKIPNTINIFPNPSNNFINLDMDNIPFSTVNIYNSLGTLVRAIQNPPNQIDISELPAGFYIIEAISNSMTINEKICVY